MAQTWRDRPAHSDEAAESREETLRSISAEAPRPTGADPSTRRGVTRNTAGLHFGAALVAFAITMLVVGLATGGWMLALAVGAAVALVASILVPLVFLEREDGRVSDEVAERSPAPATPPDQNAGR